MVKRLFGIETEVAVKCPEAPDEPPTYAEAPLRSACSSLSHSFPLFVLPRQNDARDAVVRIGPCAAAAAARVLACPRPLQCQRYPSGAHGQISRSDASHRPVRCVPALLPSRSSASPPTPLLAPSFTRELTLHSISVSSNVPAVIFRKPRQMSQSPPTPVCPRCAGRSGRACSRSPATLKVVQSPPPRASADPSKPPPALARMRGSLLSERARGRISYSGTGAGECGALCDRRLVRWRQGRRPRARAARTCSRRPSSRCAGNGPR